MLSKILLQEYSTVKRHRCRRVGRCRMSGGSATIEIPLRLWSPLFIGPQGDSDLGAQEDPDRCTPDVANDVTHEHPEHGAQGDPDRVAQEDPDHGTQEHAEQPGSDDTNSPNTAQGGHEDRVGRRKREGPPLKRTVCPRCNALVVNVFRHLRNVHRVDDEEIARQKVSSVRANCAETRWPCPECGAHMERLPRHLRELHHYDQQASLAAAKYVRVSST
jgi:hypothetical protein